MRGLVTAVLALALVVPVAAQQVTLEPSDALKCLAPATAARGAPDYPFEAYKLGQKGRVKVQLTFTGPDLTPAVQVLDEDGGPSFLDAVKQHVGKLRVPCHDRGAQPVRLIFEFVFQPDERKVFALAPQDGDAAARQAQLDCITHTSGEKRPDYPMQALRDEAQGRVVALLRFDAADKPPAVQVFTRAGTGAGGSFQARRVARMFAQATENWASGYRMPCLQGWPIDTGMVFFYLLEGRPYGFKPGLTFREFLPLVRNVRLQRLAFDFNAMGCPFDVSLLYRQPHLPNVVAEIGSQDPARQQFLDWLRQSSLDMPDDALDSVYGDTAQLTVPCLKIDLDPTKE